MRILIYGINYAPELTGIGKYTGEMAEWLAAHGHKVRIICAPPYYPAWKISEGYSAQSYTHEVLNGVTVLRCPLWIPSIQSGLRRILHLFSFAASSFPVVIGTSLLWRPDVVFVLEPSLFCTPAALLAARLSGAKSWLHIQDMEIDAAFALGLIRSSLLKRIAGSVERWVMGMFDKVTTVSCSMLDNIRRKGVLRESSGLFSNWVDSEVIYPIQGYSTLRNELEISPDLIVVLYSGNMGDKQGLEIVIEVARILTSEKKILFVLSGEGAARKRLEHSAVGLDNIRFIPLQSSSRLNDLLNLADIHILPQRPDVASLVMPSKLLGILASGRPVVVTAKEDSELAGIVRTCGIIVPPGEASMMAIALSRLADDSLQRTTFGAIARKICVAQWDSERVLAEFEKQLIYLAGGQPDA